MTGPDQRHHYWFQRHTRAALLLLGLAGCVAALVLAELGARLVFPEWAPTRQERARFWAHDELLGWSHRPGQRGRFEHPDFSVEVAINSQGLRDSEYPSERTGKKRMLVIGDSFGWGFGVELEERFSEILEAAHPDWEVINASVSGYGTDQQYLYLKERGRAMRADVVLLLFYENDFESNLSDEQYLYPKPRFILNGTRLELQNVPVPRAPLKKRIDRYFLGSTYLGPRIYYAFDVLGRRFGRQGFVPSDRQEQERQWEASFTLLRRLVAAMRDLCRRDGSELVMVSVPIRSRVKRGRLREMVEEEGIPYLSLHEFFEGRSGLKFPHDSHWNAAGHAVAARAIGAFLEASGVFALDGLHPG